MVVVKGMNFPRKDSVLGIEWSTNERFKERKFQGTNGPGIVSQILVFVGRIILDITEKHSVALICRKIWGSGSVRSSHQTVSEYALRP